MSEVQNVISDAVSEATAPVEAVESSESLELEGSSEDNNDLGEGEVGQEAAIDAAQANGKISKKEAQDLKKKLKIKVDGQEFDEEVDFNDEENLKIGRAHV